MRKMEVVRGQPSFFKVRREKYALQHLDRAFQEEGNKLQGILEEKLDDQEWFLKRSCPKLDKIHSGQGFPEKENQQDVCVCRGEGGGRCSQQYSFVKFQFCNRKKNRKWLGDYLCQQEARVILEKKSLFILNLVRATQYYYPNKKDHSHISISLKKARG